MTSQTIEELNGYLGTVMQNLKGITNIDYDTKRIYQLIEVICKDVTNQLLKILGQESLMYCSFAEFKVWYDKTNEVFKRLDDNINHFVARARGGNYAGIVGMGQNQQKANYQHIPLKNRLDQLYKIRDLYQNLKTVIEDIIARTSTKGFLSVSDIENGYNNFKGINVLDLSKEGEETLARCEK